MLLFPISFTTRHTNPPPMTLTSRMITSGSKTCSSSMTMVSTSDRSLKNDINVYYYFKMKLEIRNIIQTFLSSYLESAAWALITLITRPRVVPTKIISKVLPSVVPTWGSTAIGEKQNISHKNFMKLHNYW